MVRVPGAALLNPSREGNPFTFTFAPSSFHGASYPSRPMLVPAEFRPPVDSRPAAGSSSGLS